MNQKADHRVVAINCRHCHHRGEVEVRTVINVQLNPGIKTALLDGLINTYRCTRCGCYTEVPVPFLYHDMDLDFCVQYVPFVMVDDSNFLDFLPPEGDYRVKFPVPDDEVPYHLRHPHLVFSIEELIRYIIFRDKLA